MPKMRPNLYLIGFMGVGKSAVGRQVARHLNFEFIDSDNAIEVLEGRSVRAIFESDGEDAFRVMERAFLENGHPGEGCVVACGGGLPLAEERRRILLTRGIVICLFASIATILRRTSASSKRPLLDAPDLEERVRTLIAEREPIYMKTGIGISTEGRTLDEVARNVVRIYHREARAWSKRSPS